MRRLLICIMLSLPLAISAQAERGKIFQNEYNLNVLNHRIDSVVAATKSERLPVIGIGTLFADGRTATEQVYIDAVRSAGGAPVMIPIGDDVAAIDRILDGIDGLVIPGGEDVLPFLYGEEPDTHFGKDCLERDYFEIALIRLARQRGIPILSVCRGMQVTNVALGGTLCQDIPSADYSPKIQHGQWSTTSTPHHSISIDKGSQLYSILGAKAQVNSTHHQCVKQPAPGMRIVAKAPDGVPEAMEGDGILCVQFHPEAMIWKHPEMLGIYKWIVEKASRK